MSWKCPDCGKVLKRKSSAPAHLKLHDNPTNDESYDEAGAVEEYIATGRQLTGEIGRLRTLRQRNPAWDDVYHSSVKVSGVADTAAERKVLRAKVNQARLSGRW